MGAGDDGAFAAAGDHRVHLARATAYAERLQAAEAVAEAARATEACDREGAAKCDVSSRVRIGVVAAPMQALVDANIDPRTIRRRRARRWPACCTRPRRTSSSRTRPKRREVDGAQKIAGSSGAQEIRRRNFTERSEVQKDRKNDFGFLVSSALLSF